ncbi:hypothetical protein MMC25_003743 [Agyrium rufum]|nr:hypothetical protein [Agyrium rufum]
MTPPAIPFPYVVLLTILEPLAALNGALIAHFTPAAYLNYFTPFPTTLQRTFNTTYQPLASQVAACYLLFTFNEAVVLRLTDDVRVWKGIVLGILICDLGHLWATYEALQAGLGGGFWSLGGWRFEDWVNTGMILGPGLVRILFLLEVGFRKTTGLSGGRGRRLKGR